MGVVAIVPAAGKAERFGGEKLVVEIRGEPLLNWTLWSLLDGGVGKVVVVTAPGADFSRVRLTADPRVLLVVNADSLRGMLSSIQTGLSIVSGDPLLFLPADMPFINSSTVTAIVTACIRRQRVIVPVHHERRGHPIAVPGVLRRQILSASPEATLKDALGDAERIELPVSDPGILRDVDRPADLDQIARPLLLSGTHMRNVLHSVFGRWEPPPWIRTTGRRAAEGSRYVYHRPLLLFPIGLAIAGLAAGYVWYAMRPTPHLVTFTVAEPGLTEYNDTGIASIKPLRVTFSESAAPLKNVKNAVTSGIDLSPAVAGTWFWDSDKDLRFTPADDWPVDGAFTVTIAGRGAIAAHVTLEDYRFKFRSQPFAASIAQSQFYQDPVDPNLKKLVATVAFSHPVDTARFESETSLLVAKDGAYLGLRPDSRNFTVAYDKFKLHAYVHSMPLAMPRDDTPMSIRVAAGVRAARGGNGTKDKLEATITVPGRASLRFSDARMGVVDNAKHEPEQILFIKSSSPVPESGFTGKIVVKLLPVRHPTQSPEDRNPYQWNSSTLVGEDVLAKADTVALSYVPSDAGGDTSHGFRFRAPVGRYLHVLVKQDVPGTGGYVSGKPYAEPVKVEPYPRALKFLGEGALLAPAGDRKVGFLVRDVSTVRIEIGRVLPNQLQHLAKAMWNFAKPDLYGDLEDSVVERFVITRDYPNRTPGKPAYDSVDLTKYLQDGSAERRGSFLLRIRAVRRVPGSEDENDMDGGEYDQHGRPIEDRRLILVTDLGFFVKAAKDGSRDVFVQSIRSGLPVTGARVALVGANGLNAFTATTDATGKATFQPTPRDFPREKLPQMVVVERDSDMAFMPFRTNRRTLETSRFDTGGVENAESAQQLSTYLFSDRGIYRPGETMHLGLITRSADWRSALAGLPVTVEIADPRGQIVSKTQLSMSAGAFDEVSYPTPVSAPTGTYFVVAYLTKDPRRRESIGNTTVRVQEFEPDRLKVQLDLSSAPIEGWLKPSDVHPRVTVAHLFGAAAGGRRVEGDLSLTPVLPRFTRYPDHRFQIGEVLKEPYQETLAALTTDDKGVAEFQVDLKRFVGRAYRLNLLTRAYEAGAGRNVAAQNTAIVSGADYLVGVKPDGDLTFVKRGSVRQAHWLAVDQQLNPVAADNLFLEWVQRQFVSVLAQQNDGTLRYVSKLRETVRSSRPMAVAKGGSSLALPTNEPGDFLLVLRDASGARLNSLNYSVAGDANISRSLDREAELQVQLDKASYNGGETIGVSIRAPYAGAGLITIERDRVYRHQWFKTTTTSSVQRIALPPDFEGNGYVTVQFVRDAGSDELFVNPLSYGIAAFGADLGARTQPVTLNAPKLVKPGQTLRIRVAPGEPSRVAVLAVDEGILQVARYRSPDPLGYFFQKKMLEVQTSQVLDLILPDFARFLALAAPGGDADAGFSRHLNPFAKKRKAPVAYWSGIVSAGREGRELTYTVPDHFNGRLRIVAVSASARRVGVAETATEVRGDFILTPNVPASVTPGDEFIVSVGVYNNTTGGTGPIRVELQPGSGLSLVGAGSAELQVADRKEGVGEFRVKAGEVLGSAAMTFVARRSAAESRVVEEVGVRPAAALRTTLTLGRVDGAVAEAPVTRELFSSRRKVDAAISMTPLVWGQGLVAYLDAYEYSCTEQLLSRGFAALILYSRPEFGRVQSPSEQPLDSTLAVIRARTNDEGGLGLWAATPESHEFATLYGAHFLVEARDRGRNIPQDVLAGMNGWLARFAATPASSLADGRMRAYAVYLLARQGIRPAAAISNVEQELSNRYAATWPTDLAAAYLASTYRLMQRTTDADRIMRRVSWSAAKKDFPDPHGGTADIYYGAVVHDAQLLYLQAKHFPAMTTAAPPPALEAMARSVSQSGATSLSASYVLLALDAYAKSAAAIPLGINEIGKDGQSRALTLPTGAIPQVAVSENAARLQFTKRGQPPAYYVLAESGFDRRPQTTEVRQGVEILRDFVDDKGNVLTRVTVGLEFFVRLRLRALDRDVYRQVAVVDVLPGGVEPVLEVQAPADSSTPGQDPAMQRQANAGRTLPIGLPARSDWSPHHVDVRDDRVVLYGDANRNIGTFVYRVRANNAGTYQVPPAFAEGMYDRRIVALGRSSVLEVIKLDQVMTRMLFLLRDRNRGPLVPGFLVFVMLVLGLRFWPHAPLQARVPVSTGVWSADGELLRVTLAADEQYRLWVPLEEISPTLVDAILLKEDRWFYVHPGVNPVALSRAAFRTYSGGDRQGGSTLTMQLARLMYRLNTRAPAGKAKQAALALWLECRYSKHDLLEAYLNVAPFGGNIEGVGAASRIFFGKSPDRLTLGESLTLAVIPQRPAGRAGRAAGAGDVLAARAQLGRAWLQTHRAPGDRADAERRQVELPIVARPDYTLPWKAPHFVDALLAGGSPGGRVDTTLDSGLQRVLETQVRQFIAERGDNGLRNAAAVLVDTRHMGVKAWVGAADYWNARDGQVNGVLAKRSPGSALKPFIYALALDQGVLHPRTMLRDAPSAFGPFTPENFDGRFVGPITAQDALIRSRNIPAVWAASQLTQPSLYQFLESAGVRDLKPEAFYGLALALGGGEVTMEELAGLYAMLANGGVLKPIRMTAPSDRLSAPESVGVRLLSAEASFITLDMLRHNARPGDTGLVPARTRWPVAWKTGTSWGFRDAWTAGVAGPYVLVVWIGNFSGEGNPAFVGADAAAPLFFRIVDGLNLARPSEEAPLPVSPAGVSSVAVCVGSGDLPNADCPHTVNTWYIPGKSPIRVSQLHRAVALDAVTGAPVCAPYPSTTRFEVFEFWSSDMFTLFREAGMPRRVPPPLPACALDDRMEPPRIASPMRSVSYTLRSSTADAIPLEASVAADVQRLFWFDGNALIGSRTSADGPLSWRPATAGTRIVRVVDDHGRSADRDVTVTIRR